MSDYRPWIPRLGAPPPSRRPAPAEVLLERGREYVGIAPGLIAVLEHGSAAEGRRQEVHERLDPLSGRLLGPTAGLVAVTDDLLNPRKTGYDHPLGQTAVMPTSAGGLAHIPFVALTSPNPANTLAHEAMHTLLRSGRVTAEEENAWSDATVERACERYKLRESYSERWLREETITHVSAEWSGGKWDSEVGHFPAKVAAARKSLVQSLSLTGPQVAFLDAFDAGEFGRRLVMPDVETMHGLKTVSLDRAQSYPSAFSLGKDLSPLENSPVRPFAVGPKADLGAVRQALAALPPSELDRLQAATVIAVDRLPRGIRAYRPSVVRARRALEAGSDLLVEARRERGLPPLIFPTATGRAPSAHRGEHHVR